jgi:hypothetical protein
MLAMFPSTLLPAARTPRAHHIIAAGNGAGLLDGSYEEVAFNRPQGVAYSSREDALYVADTEAHALRCVDLRSGSVQWCALGGSFTHA